MEAERELLLKPPARLFRMGERLEVAFDLQGAHASFVEIVIAGQTLLIHSLGDPVPPRIFNTLNLPSPIDAGAVVARLEECVLVVTADACL